MSELTPDQKAYVRKVLGDPVLFATHILGAGLWKREAEILRSIQNNRRTAIKACHGAGKTYSLALAALWWLARYPQGIVLTTCPTLRQVRTQVWSEIHRISARSKIPYPELKTTELKFRGEDNFALGLSTNQAANFQGYHGKYVLIIVDEAPGIAAEIWDAIAGAMAGGKVHLVIAGNPTTPSGPFFDAFNRERGLWNCITIDAFDSPNLEGITLEQLLQMDSATGGPLDQNPVPYLVTKRWAYDQYLVWWHGDERSSPSWMSRVRGQFSDQSHNALIKLAWLERAKRRALENPVKDAGERLVAGVDVGGVDSETVVYLCEISKGNPKILKFGAWRGEDTRGYAVALLKPHRNRLATVRVDADGVGYNFGLHLRDQGLPVELVHVGITVESKPNLGADDPALRFFNQKAQLYQHVADLLERDGSMA
jgi:phage terminase large subunit